MLRQNKRNFCAINYLWKGHTSPEKLILTVNSKILQESYWTSNLFFKDFIYLFIKWEGGAEGEGLAGSPLSSEPNAGLHHRTRYHSLTWRQKLTEPPRHPWTLNLEILGHQDKKALVALRGESISCSTSLQHPTTGLGAPPPRPSLVFGNATGWSNAHEILEERNINESFWSSQTH